MTIDADQSTIPPMTASRLVEIRSYRLLPGSGADFHALVSSQSMPLHERFGIEVVAHGRSAHDGDCYFLIRAFRDLDDLRNRRIGSTPLPIGGPAPAKRSFA